MHSGQTRPSAIKVPRRAFVRYGRCIIALGPSVLSRMERGRGSRGQKNELAIVSTVQAVSRPMGEPTASARWRPK
ncbi:hypothetical protein PsYK624_085940 [Phanerochaete sordida]|uniref:Uncharacterized protein n=1 Tax=Phanerochaete sordida TaxID=48140 RepID=A0A9P3LEN6_9APHY|nr:hypothetical protein PsYK624_085940 [Phanerochaete sordida]